MPPADDPLARLHGRLVFDRVIQEDISKNASRMTSSEVPKVFGKAIDLYTLFEVYRAAKDIQGLPSGYEFILVRDILNYPIQSEDLDILKNTFQTFCAPFFHLLQSKLEAVYITESLNEHSANHKWLIDRVDVSIDEENGTTHVYLKDRGDKLVWRKNLGQENTEEQLFLGLPEFIQAVIRARLCEGTLEPEERAHYLYSTKECDNVTIDLRNHIIRMWFRNTRNRLSVYDALRMVPGRFHDLGCRIFTYLECMGVINFGIISLSSPMALHLKNKYEKKIAIIGAGMSGLIAARQLRSFGFHVTLLEARQRPGGRVFTETELFSAPVDMGAMVVTGVLQNPVSVLAHQKSLAMHFIDQRCPLFDIDGKLVSKESDSWAEKEYNTVLDVTNRYRNNERFDEIASQTSLGKAFQNSLSRRMKARVAFLNSNMAAKNYLGNQAPGRMNIGFQNGSIEEQRFMEGPAGNGILDTKVLSRLLRWHIANLEYACAASIYDISLKHWDQDDPYGFCGEHVLLKEGYKPLVDGLVNGLEGSLKLGRKVVEIDYSATNGSVKLIFEGQRGNSEGKVYDSVLVTVPLGVLKSGSISFNPTLPVRKQETIDRLGFGGLMKVAMEWSESFWTENDLFGVLRESVELRGEFFCFWNLTPSTGKYILVGMVTEPLVAEMEKLPDTEIINKALKVIRKIIPEAPDPKTFVISRWTTDDCAGGAYTNIPVGSSGADYDELASPVGKSLFFGGEHTCRKYPTTCGSAIISGLREANNIAEAHKRVKKIQKFYCKALDNGNWP